MFLPSPPISEKEWHNPLAPKPLQKKDLVEKRKILIFYSGGWETSNPAKYLPFYLLKYVLLLQNFQWRSYPDNWDSFGCDWNSLDCTQCWNLLNQPTEDYQSSNSTERLDLEIFKWPTKSTVKVLRNFHNATLFKWKYLTLSTSGMRTCFFSFVWFFSIENPGQHRLLSQGKFIKTSIFVLKIFGNTSLHT